MKKKIKTSLIVIKLGLVLLLSLIPMTVQSETICQPQKVKNLFHVSMSEFMHGKKMNSLHIEIQASDAGWSCYLNHSALGNKERTQAAKISTFLGEDSLRKAKIFGLNNIVKIEEDQLIERYTVMSKDSSLSTDTKVYASKRLRVVILKK